jgi:sugar phosphate isomerase/epimerase
MAPTPPPIGLGLYTVRADLERDFAGTLRAVADMGYVGVETAGFPGSTPQAAAQLFKDLGLTVCAAHSPLPLGEKKNEVLDTMAVLGVKRIVCPWQPPELFQSLEGIRQVCDTLTEASAVAQEHGLSLGYHNHWFEFAALEGQTGIERLAACLPPEVFFEIDTYWAHVAGADAQAVVGALGPRVPLLHIKDGPGQQGQPMLPLGEGVMDIPRLLSSAGSAEWLVVELDEYAGTMLDAVRRSYDYLVGSGLASGR